MRRSIHARLVAIVSALLLTTFPAMALEPPKHVIDEIGFFGDAAKTKANEKIAEIKKTFNKDLVIEAAAPPTLPATVDAGDKAAVNRFYGEWAHERYKQLGVQGVYLVIVPKTQKIEYQIGRDSQGKHYFTADDGHALIAKVGPMLVKNPDEALTTAVDFVDARMHQHHAAANPFALGNQAPRVVQGGGAQAAPANPTGNSGWSIVWTVLGVIIVAWIVIAVIRGLTGAMGGRGAPGYGGGGGGFMSSMLGGLFGAAAGMYLYNSFFGHGNSAWGAGGGDYGSTSDPNAGDATSSGGGGDYGDNSGGGGDWGGGDAGGGDAGGGGDWGGGGGDWGGGGGGDWGGGGGGGGDW